MNDEPDSLQLLQRIADLLDTDVETFLALSDVVHSDDTNPDLRNSNESLLLHRVVRAFRGIPSKEIRLIALQMLESFSEVARERAESTPASRKARVVI